MKKIFIRETFKRSVPKSFQVANYSIFKYSREDYIEYLVDNFNAVSEKTNRRALPDYKDLMFKLFEVNAQDRLNTVYDNMLKENITPDNELIAIMLGSSAVHYNIGACLYFLQECCRFGFHPRSEFFSITARVAKKSGLTEAAKILEDLSKSKASREELVSQFHDKILTRKEFEHFRLVQDEQTALKLIALKPNESDKL